MNGVKHEEQVEGYIQWAYHKRLFRSPADQKIVERHLEDTKIPVPVSLVRSCVIPNVGLWHLSDLSPRQWDVCLSGECGRAFEQA